MLLSISSFYSVCLSFFYRVPAMPLFSIFHPANVTALIAAINTANTNGEANTIKPGVNNTGAQMS